MHDTVAVDKVFDLATPIRPSFNSLDRYTEAGN
jgi:hypothetical protein